MNKEKKMKKESKALQHFFFEGGLSPSSVSVSVSRHASETNKYVQLLPEE